MIRDGPVAHVANLPVDLFQRMQEVGVLLVADQLAVLHVFIHPVENLLRGINPILNGLPLLLCQVVVVLVGHVGVMLQQLLCMGLEELNLVLDIVLITAHHPVCVDLLLQVLYAAFLHGVQHVLHLIEPGYNRAEHADRRLLLQIALDLLGPDIQPGQGAVDVVVAGEGCDVLHPKHDGEDDPDYVQVEKVAAALVAAEGPAGANNHHGSGHELAQHLGCEVVHHHGVQKKHCQAHDYLGTAQVQGCRDPLLAGIADVEVVLGSAKGVQIPKDPVGTGARPHPAALLARTETQRLEREGDDAHGYLGHRS
mmetsp:Transcript_8536/g.24493  ORF Transcript_8536/g.24493 Transcript_8536/m.24493 type:complete len:310 (-) Transcript_8536:105-1034(-)